ncbi:hypothetical protein, partial [Ideonella sp.]|uniref:hypothetical protein n=1 Tax=Ideonella sp. TaxID=1929293 RepID=UPI003BB554FC
MSQPGGPRAPKPVDLSPEAWGRLPPLVQSVLLGLALGAVPRPRSWVYELLMDPAMRPDSPQRPTQEQIRNALQVLGEGGWAEQDLRRTGYWVPAVAAVSWAWTQLMDLAPPATLRDALARVDGYPALSLTRIGSARIPTVEAAVARVRLDLLSGGSWAQLEALAPLLPWG